MPRYVIDLEFDGSHFQGSAIQTPDIATVQGTIARIAGLLERREGPLPTPSLRLSGRLDAGVAAIGLPAHLDLERSWQPLALGRALNGHLTKLPLVVRRVAEAPAADWCALRAPSRKTYRYRLVHRGSAPVLDRTCLWVRHLPYPERLASGIALLPGTRDLSGFACLRGDPSDGLDPVRPLIEASCTPVDIPGGTAYDLRFTGAGFLYKQVRGFAGALLHCAQHEEADPQQVLPPVIAAGRSAQRLGQIAPAKGLRLEQVVFDQEPAWQWL